MKTTLAKFTILATLFISPVASAQMSNQSYTDLNTKDLHLMDTVLSKCEILSDVSESINAKPPSSDQIYELLQKTDNNGNLLIDNDECSESILNFVSSICSSNTLNNNFYCNTLGIQQANDDYKSFGSSAFSSLNFHSTDLPSFESEESQSFSVAGMLFAFTPVKKLRLLKPLSKVASAKIKPVLSGAMLILASLGLASCDDLVSPTQICRDQEGYFLFEVDEGDPICIEIPRGVITFTDSNGNPITQNSTQNDVSIHITFDSEVVLVGDRGTESVNKATLENILSLYYNKINVVSAWFDYTNYEVGTNDLGNTVITIKPPFNGIYPPGFYEVSVRNIVKARDASKLTKVTNVNEYISSVEHRAFFEIGEADLSCETGQTGYFKLEGILFEICLKLPTIDFIDSKKKIDLIESDVERDLEIKIEFDSKITYLTEDEWISSEHFTKLHLLNMLEIGPRDGDKINNLVGKEISLSELDLSTNSDGNTVITISPPNSHKYKGSTSPYEVRVKKLCNAKRCRLSF